MKIICFHLNQVGDLAFSLPALRCVRDSFPDANIISVVRPSVGDVLESTCLVDSVVSRNNGINMDKLRLANRLASIKPDLAIVFSQSAECAVLAFLSRAPRRIGFINTSLGCLLTEQVEFHHPPSTENNLRLVAAAGCSITHRDYFGFLKPTPEQIESANRLLEANGIGVDAPIVSLSPGTSGRRSVKEWTDEGFAVVGRHIIDRGYKTVILGTQPAFGIVKNNPEIIDLSGHTTLAQAVAILHRSRTLVAVDSGILHLCAAAGTRVIGLYGPSDPAITGPQGEGHKVLTSGADCSPCIKTECAHSRKCMTNLKAEDVISAVDELLEAG